MRTSKISQGIVSVILNRYFNMLFTVKNGYERLCQEFHCIFRILQAQNCTANSSSTTFLSIVLNFKMSCVIHITCMVVLSLVLMYSRKIAEQNTYNLPGLKTVPFIS